MHRTKLFQELKEQHIQKKNQAQEADVVSWGGGSTARPAAVGRLWDDVSVVLPFKHFFWRYSCI